MNIKINNESHSDSENKETFKDNYVSLSCATLNENFTEAPPIEDISIFCKICKSFIYYGEITVHRKIHTSLNLLQINGFDGLTFKTLAKRRSKFIKHLKQYPANEGLHLLRKVDMAYANIYNFLIGENNQEINIHSHSKEDNFPYKYGHKNNLFNNTVTGSLFCEVSTGFDIGFGINTHSEDQKPSIICKTVFDTDVCFAIVTGLNGNCAKKYVTENLIESLKTNYDASFTNSNDNKNLSDAVERTFVELDRRLGTGLHDNATYKSWSSCCVEMVVVSRRTEESCQLTVMNVGDGAIILVTKNGHRVLSTFHSMTNETEVERIENLGGTNVIINGEPFLNGTTQTTQMLGGYGNSKNKQCQMPQSKCYNLQLDLDNDLGIIIMNRELARFVSVEDATEIFKSELAVPNSFFVDNKESPLIFEELINFDTLKTQSSESSIFSNNNDFNEKQSFNKEEIKSRIIARKIVNAGILCSNFDSEFGVLTFVFQNTNGFGI